MLDAARASEGYIKTETLAAERLAFDGDGKGAAATIDGRELLIELTRA